MKASSQTHLPSLFSSLLFLLGALFFLSISLVTGVSALISLLTGETVQANLTILFLVLGFEGVLLLIATFVSILKFLNKQSAEQNIIFFLSVKQILLCIIVAGISIIFGSLISSNDSVNWIFLPILTIPAVVLPLWLLLSLTARNLSLGMRWQTWNVFGLGMTLGPLILITLEVAVLIFGFLISIFYVVSQPELLSELERLSNELVILGPNSEDAANLVAPYLTRPGVILGALAYFALIIPALEEIFKPIGVWFLARKLDSQAQGFALGALSGAAFALAETFGVSGQTAEWGILLFTRIGTGILHITTSALMGAAIVLAWRERRYWQLLRNYILVVSLHGVWNALALTSTFSTLMELFDQQGLLRNIQLPISIGMSLLAVGMFVFLIFYNRKMRDVQSKIQGLGAAENLNSDP
ncbi:MAG TPA: PrsW family glutamic-type intramembrane protease, partial [Anaerolineales bacterium]|nr:PrsW family glutamic-type intramembrane protease [Anaerolineales bacterium]